MSEAKDKILKLKRKRTTQRARSSRFINKINEFNESSPLEEIEHYLERLQDTQKNLTLLDDSIQDLLDDRDYEEDVEGCEQYLDRSKRTILKAKTLIKQREEESRASISTIQMSPTTFVPEVRLPSIKLEPFRGDIESWSRFWEQFESSVDKNPCVSDINKHVFLRGYLEGEPKSLVDGIAITGETYEQTKRILQSRYGDKNRIIQAHIDYLESLKPAPYSASPEELNDTFVECQRRIHALTALGEDVDVYGRVLAPKLLRAFPEDICRRWLIHSKRINVPEHRLTQLLDFLNEEVQGALDTQKIRGDTSKTSYTPTAAALHVSFRSRQKRENPKRLFTPYCVFCEDKGHWAQDCQKITTVQDRMGKVKSAGRCYLCLNRGHRVGQCPKKGKASCIQCKKQHHVSLCDVGNTLSTSVAKVDTNTLNPTYLQTAKVWIKGPMGRSKLTRCILDTGSQSSFIHESLISLLQLDTMDRKDLVVTAFESSSRTSGSRRQVKFDITGHDTNFKIPVHAFESSNVYSTHPTTPLDITTLITNNKIKLADPTDGSRNLPIEVLIGADHYWKIVKSQNPIRISPSLVLVPTVFGWILSGNRSSTTLTQTAVHHISLQESTELDNAVRQFWELESIGIQEKQDRTFTAKDDMILKDFQNSYSLEDGRRVVSLPRKKDIQFTSNVHTAEKRFGALEKRLKEDDEFRLMYCRQMSDYIAEGQVEIVPANDLSEDIYYLPHHAVKKQTGDLLKYRIVFDASSHENGSPSLNDALETGPNLLPEILATLLRFRQYPRAVVSDGSQAFLQLSLHENDRDLTRFFWYRLVGKHGDYDVTDDVVTYRFTRLPFGLASSPFLLSATLRELASLYREEYPTAAMIIDKSTFMDDFTISLQRDDQAVTAYHELTSLLKRIKLPLSKWATNSIPLKEIWNAEGMDPRIETSVLGVKWNTEEDFFAFDFQHILDYLSEELGSKRNVLRGTARFYDPLGLLAPVLITAKILFQDIWRRGLDWEEILPPDLAQRWQHWLSELPQLALLRVPRWIGASAAQDKSEVHAFCDASEKAYGAVLYLRSMSDSTHSVRLICSKCRLAPIKKITLPRLELLAALIGTRLLYYFSEETDFKITQAVLWSDSKVTLGWIRSDPNRWKPFISNRVNEILKHTAPSQWRHCPGEANPADFLSRGLSADVLNVTDTWWCGPSWLGEERTSWPQEVTSDEISLPEARKSTPHVLLIAVREPLLDISRFSSYWKILHITSWVLRFVKVTRKEGQYPSYLTAGEIDAAQLHWIRRVQEECFTVELTALSRGEPIPPTSKITIFNPFLEDGLIRLGGRLQFADLTENEKHPLLLDGSHHFTHLLIKETHMRLHHLGVRAVLSELRSNFWILKARQIIKKIIHSCLPCKMMRRQRCEQLEAQLPMDRIKFQQPFTVCGIDFAGPLYVKAGGTTKKSYIVLFTCAVTRAIHLELATDMSTDKFLLAFRRFTGRRGLPSTIYSDNARTFHAANKEMSELWEVLKGSKLHTDLSHCRITWKFIAPRAAWWGGFWERMIGTTKRCLKRILGRAQVEAEELYTILVNIEATINSRPITQSEDNSEILTPSHFLTGGKLTSLPSTRLPETNQNLTKMYQQRQQLVEMFEKRWKTEYLLQLRNYHEVKQPKQVRELRVGDIALLQENVKSPIMWKRGRVCDLRPGRDNRVRTVVLQLPDGSKITRPVQLVVPLEVDRPEWGGCGEL